MGNATLHRFASTRFTFATQTGGRKSKTMRFPLGGSSPPPRKAPGPSLMRIKGDSHEGGDREAPVDLTGRVQPFARAVGGPPCLLPSPRDLTAPSGGVASVARCWGPLHVLSPHMGPGSSPPETHPRRSWFRGERRRQAPRIVLVDKWDGTYSYLARPHAPKRLKSTRANARRKPSDIP